MNKLKLVILSSWLTLTLFVDIAFVPVLFRTLKGQPYLAGSIGVKAFSVVNPIEVVFGIILLLIGLKLKKQHVVQFYLSLTLLVLAILYTFYFSPQISFYAQEMQKFQLTNPVDFVKAQVEHRLYHGWYVRLDSLKMLILTFMLTLNLVKKAE